MSVMNNDANEGQELLMESILNQLKLIDERSEDRQRIYQQCLNKYKDHLNLQTQQLNNSDAFIEKRNNNIRQSFQIAYDSIYEGSDRALRNIRRTYEVKKQFWLETIKQFVGITDLEIKKDLYTLKRQAQQKYQDAIDSQKSLAKLPFQKAFRKQKEDNPLVKFQETNNIFQQNVYSNAFHDPKWKPLQNTYFGTVNKQNSSLGNNRRFTARQFLPQAKEAELFLNDFIKK